MDRFKSQAEFEEKINLIVEKAGEEKDKVNGMLSGTFVECNLEEKSATLEYKIKPWENNRAGFVHGGVIAAILDLTMGDLSICFSDEVWTPSVSMEVKYIRPGSLDDTFLTKAYVVSEGSTLNHMRGEIRSKNTGKIIASATGIYFCKDIRKDKK